MNTPVFSGHVGFGKWRFSSLKSGSEFTLHSTVIAQIIIFSHFLLFPNINDNHIPNVCVTMLNF